MLNLIEQSASGERTYPVPCLPGARGGRLGGSGGGPLTTAMQRARNGPGGPSQRCPRVHAPAGPSGSLACGRGAGNQLARQGQGGGCPGVLWVVALRPCPSSPGCSLEKCARRRSGPLRRRQQQRLWPWWRMRWGLQPGRQWCLRPLPGRRRVSGWRKAGEFRKSRKLDSQRRPVTERGRHMLQWGRSPLGVSAGGP